MKVIVGTDFDNTVVSYAGLFERAALDLGVEVSGDLGGDRSRLRDSIRRSNQDGELLWQKIQARVYGLLMREARLMEGFAAFVSRCRAGSVPLRIVSHKSQFPAQDPRLDLREVALAWMRVQGFFDRESLAFKETEVFFEPTRESKIARIEALGCTHFVDDLAELLSDSAFPAGTEKICLSRDETVEDGGLRRLPGWPEITEFLFESLKR